jgi:hypothetical protein
VLVTVYDDTLIVDEHSLLQQVSLCDALDTTEGDRVQHRVLQLTKEDVLLHRVLAGVVLIRTPKYTTADD